MPEILVYFLGNLGSLIEFNSGRTIEVLVGLDVLLKREGTTDGFTCHALLLGTISFPCVAFCICCLMILAISSSGFFGQTVVSTFVPYSQ